MRQQDDITNIFISLYSLFLASLPLTITLSNPHLHSDLSLSIKSRYPLLSSTTVISLLTHCHSSISINTLLTTLALLCQHETSNSIEQRHRAGTERIVVVSVDLARQLKSVCMVTEHTSHKKQRVSSSVDTKGLY
jgi:hypothetical protein